MFFALEFLKSNIVSMNNKLSSFRNSIVFVILLFLIIFLWWNTQFIISYMSKIKPNDYTARGAYGDSFGLVTSLFSSLTFFLVLYGIYYQRKEMATQKEMVDISKKQHYFDRAYEFLENNLPKLKQKEQELLSSINSPNTQSMIEDWNTIQLSDLNNIEQSAIEIINKITSAINFLEKFSNSLLPQYIIYFSDLDKLINKLLASEISNRDDYESLMEIIKLSVDKQFRSTIIKALRFYDIYFASELSKKVIRIKTNKMSYIDLKPQLESNYYNLQAFNKWPGVFL